MFAAFNVTNAGEAVVWGAGVVGAIVAVFRLFGTYILSPYAKNQDRKDDERIERAIQPLRDEIGLVRYEVQYNDGGSLKDAVRRTDRRLIRLEARFEEHDSWTHKAHASDPDDLEPGL